MSSKLVGFILQYLLNLPQESTFGLMMVNDEQ